MGAYLSEPIVDKESSDLEGKRVNCGASSMQGWRVTQEDAHNCVLDYDTETSFFAVYDGHGGNEVAVYSADNFPQFLKDCETYKKGDFEEALKEAFLGFDAKLATPIVVSALKEIAGNKDGEQNDESEDDEENVRNLFEEAEMPLEQVMAKYHSDLNPGLKKLTSPDGEKSPFIHCKRAAASGASGSGALVVSSVSSSSDEVSSSSSLTVSTSSVEESTARKITFVSETSSNKKQIANDVKDVNGTAEPDSSVETKDQGTGIVSSNEEDKTDSLKTDINITESSPVKKQELNGVVDSAVGVSSDKKCEDPTPNTVPCENQNGEGDAVPYVGKGKGKAKILTAEETSAKAKHMMVLRENAAAALYKAIIEAQEKSDSDSDSDDPGDETFEGAESSDDDADENDAEDDEGEEEEEEEDDEDDSAADEEEEEDEDDDFTMKMTDEPGYDSGCTAVMALLHGRDLYVANAGDSRCIVCRNGSAVEMSLDHKPEDTLESTRIVKAGGKVTADGRVNGGLNLSRALGDHAYKLNAELPAQEQMITALPDVRTLVIDPLKDEFMVLACDGIWNFMTSQEVCDFVRPRVQEGKLKLSAICEELFDHCLAPNTLGDGTGCDNMTAVIVKFHPTLAAIAESSSIKRSASTSPIPDEKAVKRAKSEEHLLV